jgi:uncharacterized lipoprotein YmbA
MNPNQHLRPALATVLIAFTLAGCLNLKPAVDPTRFYVLTATVADPELPTGSAPSHVVLGRVEVADYLRAPQLAFRVTPNQIEYANHHQWAEPLDAALPRILGENFLSRLTTGSPSVAVTPPREVRFSFLRFDLTRDGTARVEAICRVIDGTSRKVLAERQLARETTTTPNGTDFDIAVAALSAQLGELTDEAIALAQTTRP